MSSAAWAPPTPSTLLPTVGESRCLSAGTCRAQLSRRPLTRASTRSLVLQSSLLGSKMNHTSEPALADLERKDSSVRRRKIECQYTLDDVQHVRDFVPDIKTYPNPLFADPSYALVETSFVDDDDIVLQTSLTSMHSSGTLPAFRRAGPREEIYFNPQEVRAAIVTCGGLCPGLNTVIRELVWGLWFQYGVRHIRGIDGGYRGFYARNWVDLDPRTVTDIHRKGGTFLGTSRGGHETHKIVDSIEDRGVNQVYIIGGDGTQRGALKISEECRRRGLAVSVAGIPKTIDNDIPIIDKSFGFDTAVEEAQRAINAAHTEAESTHNCVGIVKLMGRDCGQIALHATLASRDVDCCLCPEAPFHLDGEDGLLKFIENRLLENDHCVIVIAEGAGQDLVKAEMDSLPDKTDPSGNRALLDVGLWLSDKIKCYFSSMKKEMTLKYIDPTYMIRAIPANAGDNIYCTLLAHSAIHGAMAGYTGFISGPVNGRHCYIPIDKLGHSSNRVSLTNRMWARLLASTSQPTFLKFGTEEMKKKAAMLQSRSLSFTLRNQQMGIADMQSGLTSALAAAVSGFGSHGRHEFDAHAEAFEESEIRAAVAMPSPDQGSVNGMH